MMIRHDWHSYAHVFYIALEEDGEQSIRGEPQWQPRSGSGAANSANKQRHARGPKHRRITNGKHIAIALTEIGSSESPFSLDNRTRSCFDCSPTFWQAIRRLSELVMSGNRVPINYHTPSFPSLYDPMPYDHKQAYYLYYTTDIWRFTLYWTLLFYGTFHLTVASCAVLTHCRNWSVIWLVPLVYVVVASLQALMAGSIVGLVYVFQSNKIQIEIFSN